MPAFITIEVSEDFQSTRGEGCDPWFFGAAEGEEQLFDRLTRGAAFEHLVMHQGCAHNKSKGEQAASSLRAKLLRSINDFRRKRALRTRLHRAKDFDPRASLEQGARVAESMQRTVRFIEGLAQQRARVD